MIKAMTPRSDPSGKIQISFEQAHGFPHAKWNEYFDATCEECGKIYQVLMDWQYRDRPRYFYCSHPCYSSSRRSETHPQ